jgi:galactosyl transferase GMA12/MNN10 family
MQRPMVLHFLDVADIGYDLMTVDLSSYPITHTTHAVWGKLPALLEACEKYPDAEWIWWLDIDAIIMNPEIDLFQHLLSPQILQTRLTQGDVIPMLNDDFAYVDTGLRTTVLPQIMKTNK